MKIGLFTDCHYCKSQLGGGRDAKASFEKIKKTMDAFKESKVDLCFCLGDLTDNGPKDTKESVSECFKETFSLISSYGIPFYLVPGNHDYLILKAEELCNLVSYRLPPYTVEAGKYDFIVLDANYRSSGVRFDIEGVEWTDSNLPEHQLEYLKNALDSSDKKCIVLVHENLDPALHVTHVIKNADKAREIIRESGKVSLVLQGHYHGGAEAEIDGIPYITLPAMCEHNEGYYKILEL